MFKFDYDRMYGFLVSKSFEDATQWYAYSQRLHVLGNAVASSARFYRVHQDGYYATMNNARLLNGLAIGAKLMADCKEQFTKETLK